MERFPAARAIVVLVCVGLFAAPAGAVSKKKVCRQTCNDAIATCISQGYRPKTCNREVIALCVQGASLCTDPPMVCQPGTTTTTVGEGPTTTTTLSCGVDFQDTICRACSQASCCDKLTACATDSTCLCYFQCGSFSQECGAQCGLANPTSTELHDCINQSCSGTCFP